MLVWTLGGLVMLCGTLALAELAARRRSNPAAEAAWFGAPYRMPGNWFIPAVFVAAVLWILLSALAARPTTTLAGVALTLAGIPIYLWRRPRQT